MSCDSRELAASYSRNLRRLGYKNTIHEDPHRKVFVLKSEAYCPFIVEISYLGAATLSGASMSLGMVRDVIDVLRHTRKQIADERREVQS